MGKKIMVTGCGGFIGGHLTRTLAAQGEDLVAAGITRPDYLKDPAASPNVKFVSIHLARPETFAPALEGVDRVYHTAALFSFYQEEKLLYKINAEGTDAFCRAAAAAGVKELINWSSGAIYGAGYGNRQVTEDDPPRPNDKYTRSKWAQEQAAFSYNGEKMQVISLRPGAVYGPGSTYGDATALWLLKRGILCVIPGFGDYYSSHCHVDDMVAAALHLGGRPESYNPKAAFPGETAYNVTDDKPMSTKELLLMANKLIPQKGLLGVFIPVPVPVTMLRAVAWSAETFAKVTGTAPLLEYDSIDYIAAGHAMSNAKLKTTGFQLRHPHLNSALADTIRWYEENEWRVFKA